MKITAKERAEANAARREEYEKIREVLARVARGEDPDATTQEKIQAAQLLYEIDTNGAPVKYRW